MEQLVKEIMVEEQIHHQEQLEIEVQVVVVELVLMV
jgi:hypothetical protein